MNEPAEITETASVTVRLNGRHSFELFCRPEVLPADEPGRAAISLGRLLPNDGGPLTIETSDPEYLDQLAWSCSRAIGVLKGETAVQP